MSLEVHGAASGQGQGDSGVWLPDAMETMMDERFEMQCRQELDRVERLSKASGQSTEFVTGFHLVYSLVC